MKVLVITGAAQGIGLSTAALFSEQGFTVISIGPARGGFEYGTWIAADPSERNWLEKAQGQLGQAVQHAGEIVLVHNTAMLLRDSIEQSDDGDLQQALQANIIAPIQLTRFLLPYMDVGSAIVYVGSSLAERAVPKRLSYVVSQHAQIGLMRATALEIAGRDMHTVCVCPGMTDSEWSGRHLRGDQPIEPFVLRNASLKKALQPDSIAQLIYFCAHAQAVNGSVIHANFAGGGSW